MAKKRGETSGLDQARDRKSRLCQKRNQNHFSLSKCILNISVSNFDFIYSRTDIGPDSRDAPSPQVGWGNYKKDHPDEYRTPVKEENFPWNARMEVDGDEYYRGRGGRNGNGGRFGRMQQDWDSRGHMRGNRGGRNQDNGGRYMNGRGAGPIQPFIGRGGARGPVGNNFSFMGLNSGFPDLANASPEIIRKEVIPTLVRMGEEGKRSGSMNEASFRELMSQVLIFLLLNIIVLK